jgi:HSP20 family molecular chaperone IbpA
MSDSWWRRRKKRSRWFNDIYNELERLGEMIDETMQKAFDGISEDKSVKPTRIRGFFIKVSPDGKAKLREYNDFESISDESKLVDDLEPLVDIIEKRDVLIVLVALQGVQKDDIDLRVTENCLIVSIDAEEFDWYDEFKLPTRVKPKSAFAYFKNGVLEVHLEKFKKKLKNDGILLKK